jgi:voltage-gated potassium channel
MNRGLRSLARAMRRQGAGYVAVLTVIVTLAGAAGMLVFEGADKHGGFSGFGDALWWTAMLVTTVGSDYWPRTVEGRILALLIAVYAVAVFGYLAASLASYFVGNRSNDAESRPASGEAVEALRREISELRDELARTRPQA